MYDERLPTPEAVRQAPHHPWTDTHSFYAGGLRKVRFKQMTDVLWPTGGRRQRLHVLRIAPTPYRSPNHGWKRCTTPGPRTC